jgi:uncharacterized protein YbcI
MLAGISTSIVQIFKRLYGKGPERARSYLNDDYVICVLEGSLVSSEETLLQAGEERVIRSYRERFEEAITDEICGRVSELTGRKVTGYHSQIIFRPETRVFEIFVLGESGYGVPVAGG